MPNAIQSMDELQAHYGEPNPASLKKVVAQVTPAYRQWIEASRFVVLSTVGPEGTDASPRGDDRPVVHVSDPTTILLPDWRGNNRIDSLRNIVRDSRVSLLFMVPGCQNVVRINGSAILTADDDVRTPFERNGVLPATVVVITISELYYQCAKALMRSDLWNRGDESAGIPTAGQFIRELDKGFDADSYDAGYPAYAADKMW